MTEKHPVRILIPALNEEQSIQLVLKDLFSLLKSTHKSYSIKEIIVVDNNSIDKTSEVAKKMGATVLTETRKGYGSACLKGLEYIFSSGNNNEIIVFLDADYSDDPLELEKIIEPILNDKADLVIGSRTLGVKEKGSMTFAQTAGNALAALLIRIFYHYEFTDLGPFRAIRKTTLASLNMKDKNFGWTVEMQIKAAKAKIRCFEVPVTYKRRIGKSKISGTVKGTILAGSKILWLLFKSLVK